ncbi:MAG: hypothetical protein LBH61_01430 [Dysgonamonadaceae bacterium]|nr:hypothetical protein [Dysgonamonadaceae bacterium]
MDTTGHSGAGKVFFEQGQDLSNIAKFNCSKELVYTMFIYLSSCSFTAPDFEAQPLLYFSEASYKIIF